MKKILIVEDELIVRSIYRRKFEMSGYQVETAEEGTAALSLMVHSSSPMPSRWISCCREWMAWKSSARSDPGPSSNHVPILVISSFYRPDLAEEAWKAGATKCVSKMDCTPNLALELIEQMLSGENSGFTPKFGVIPIAEGTIERTPPGKGQEQSAGDGTKLTPKQDAPAGKSRPSPSLAEPAARRSGGSLQSRLAQTQARFGFAALHRQRPIASNFRR